MHIPSSTREAKSQNDGQLASEDDELKESLPDNVNVGPIKSLRSQIGKVDDRMKSTVSVEDRSTL